MNSDTLLKWKKVLSKREIQDVEIKFIEGKMSPLPKVVETFFSLI